eukprot:GHVQ01009340.1.p1 GENE.GHVQ01009340.1~~GHVQ01009340.1.p1  ORF type:complete len:429 (+),score=45.96 GHVQ01009340.1:431-1717(+)
MMRFVLLLQQLLLLLAVVLCSSTPVMVESSSLSVQCVEDDALGRGNSEDNNTAFSRGDADARGVSNTTVSGGALVEDMSTDEIHVTPMIVKQKLARNFLEDQPDVITQPTSIIQQQQPPSSAVLFKQRKLTPVSVRSMIAQQVLQTVGWYMLATAMVLVYRLLLLLLCNQNITIDFVPHQLFHLAGAISLLYLSGDPSGYSQFKKFCSIIKWYYLIKMVDNALMNAWQYVLSYVMLTSVPAKVHLLSVIDNQYLVLDGILGTHYVTRGAAGYNIRQTLSFMRHRTSEQLLKSLEIHTALDENGNIRYDLVVSEGVAHETIMAACPQSLPMGGEPGRSFGSYIIFRSLGESRFAALVAVAPLRSPCDTRGLPACQQGVEWPRVHLECVEPDADELINVPTYLDFGVSGETSLARQAREMGILKPKKRAF